MGFENYSGPTISRGDAIATGYKVYFTGVPCKHGHLAQRRVENDRCCVCNVLRMRTAYDPEKEAARKKRRRTKHIQTILKQNRAAYQRNRERILGTLKSKRTANPSKHKNAQALWRLCNPELHRKRARDWQQNNPEKNRELRQMVHRNRRARLAGAVGRHTKSDVIEIRLRQNDICLGCGAKLNGGGHLDHKVPLSKGGTNDPTNLQFLCATCNLRKSSLDWEEFLRRQSLDYAAKMVAQI